MDSNRITARIKTELVPSVDRVRQWDWNMTSYRGKCILRVYKMRAEVQSRRVNESRVILYGT